MLSTRKIAALKRISIIPFLFACIPLVFVYLFLRDIPMLNSMFVDYVNSGLSIFFPDLPYSTIAFNFTTSHLIDIVIILNVIASLERTGYHYYVNVCLKRNYNEHYLEPYYLGTYDSQEDTPQDLKLIYGLEENSEFLLNEQFNGNPFSQKNIVKVNQFNRNSGLSSSTTTINCANSYFLYDLYKNNTIPQDCSFYLSTDSYLPSIIKCLAPTSFNKIHQKEGRIS